MSVPVREFLRNRRDRALGSVMGYLEREIYSGLDEAQRMTLRRNVIDAINSYHDSVLDLLKAEDNSNVRNDEVLAILTRIDRKVGKAGGS